MNSMIFLVSLISFVSLCQGQGKLITTDGTAAIAALLEKLSSDVDVKGFIETGLDLAMPKKTADEQTTLKAAAALITGPDMILLGDDVIAAATAEISEAVVSNFLDRVLVTYKLSKTLGLTAGDIENKAIKALSVAIGPMIVADTSTLKANVALLSEAQIRIAGAEMITAAKDTATTPIPPVTTTAFLKAINDAAYKKTTIDKLANALNKELDITEKAKITAAIPLAYDKLEPEAQVELQKSTGKLNDAQIKVAGKGMITAAKDSTVDPILPATVATFFTAINTAAANSSPVTQCSVTLLIVSVAGAALYRSIGSL